VQQPPQSVDITVTPPKLDLTASPTVINGPQSVTFTASVTPAPPNGWNVWSWTWKPDVGSGGIAPNGCNWWEKTCTRTISKQGWMKATATVGGYSLSDSVRVWLIPCPPIGDTIIDNPDIREELIAQQVASISEGLERGGVIARNNATQRDSLIHLPGLTRRACLVKWPLQFAPVPGYTIVVFWHTHWVPNGYNCTDDTINPPYSWTAVRGMSRGDWHSPNVLNCPLHTVEQNKIWKANPTLSGGLYGDNHSQKFPPRAVDRSSSTTNCVSWPVAVPNENQPPYTC
jgi:hypothetical protein